MVAATINQASSRDDPAEQETPLRLSLDDLIADEHGEIVIHSEGIEVINLVGAIVTHAGVVDFHITAGGDDVAGFQFLTFENGVTLYYEPSLKIQISPS